MATRPRQPEINSELLIPVGVFCAYFIGFLCLFISLYMEDFRHKIENKMMKRREQKHAEKKGFVWLDDKVIVDSEQNSNPSKDASTILDTESKEIHDFEQVDLEEKTKFQGFLYLSSILRIFFDEKDEPKFYDAHEHFSDYYHKTGGHSAYNNKEISLGFD